MKGYDKYERAYFMPPVCTYDWVKKDYVDKAPIWCSVDLRDGNQALIEPMSLDILQKLPCAIPPDTGGRYRIQGD